MTPVATTRVLLADDHTLVRAGVRRILEAQAGFAVVGEVADGHAALAALKTQPADVLVLDLTMPGGDGFDVLRRAKTIRPELKVLVLTMHASPEYVSRAVREGADGYLLKDSAVQDLVAAIQAVMAGREYYSPPVQRELSAMVRGTTGGKRRIEPITDREREVLKLVGLGMSNAEIAAALYITTGTAKTHVARLLAKLDARDRVRLVITAYEAGLVPLPR